MHFFHRWVLKLLSAGIAPKHIAFIMDGNRRYASKKGIEKLQGHKEGLESLKRTLEWCLLLGISEVSVFAFAIENFKRDSKEVDYLMELAQKSLLEMSQNQGFLSENKVKVKICGNLSLLKQDVRDSMDEVMKNTKENNKLLLNICFAYNSDYELNEAFLKTTEGTVQDFNNQLLIPSSPDILIRTSNEIRLSNFMIYQCRGSLIYFLEESWPELSIWSMVKIFLLYQTQERKLNRLKKMTNIN